MRYFVLITTCVLQLAIISGLYFLKSALRTGEPKWHELLVRYGDYSYILPVFFLITLVVGLYVSKRDMVLKIIILVLAVFGFYVCSTISLNPY